MLNVLYLAANIGDAAVARRVAMLSRGGASISIAGFRRAGSAAPSFAEYLELGETFDARFVQRILSVIRASGRLGELTRNRRAPDLIIARNLEMLFLAMRLRSFWPDVPIAYECLDIHRLMLRTDTIGRMMRGLERHLARGASLLLISSPAFAREYFDKVNVLDLPVLLIENKVFGVPHVRGRNPVLASGGSAPLTIGWFGALRCQKSLAILQRFAQEMDGRVEVILRGRPAYTEFADFDAAVSASPQLRYAGPYRSPDDLASIYGDVQLCWAIDFFEEGLNSRWLLPNRVYEGCLNGAVPIALAGTETAAFLDALGLGIILPDTEPATLKRMVGDLTPQRLRELAAAVAAAPVGAFACDDADCRALVSQLTNINGVESIALEVAA